jgi:hypothetical protein
VGFEIKPAASRVTWRLAAEYWATSYGGCSDSFSCQGSWGESSTFGIQALGVRSFGRGRLQPYLFGGAGLYSTRSVGVGRQFIFTDSGFQPGSALPFSRNEVEPVLLWGPGFNLRLFKLNMFGEVRMPLIIGRSIKVGPQPPLILGLRF